MLVFSYKGDVLFLALEYLYGADSMDFFHLRDAFIPWVSVQNVNNKIQTAWKRFGVQAR